MTCLILPTGKPIYLIQRIHEADNKGKKGVDRFFSMDYMGSSEFEWGELPASLKRMRASPFLKPQHLNFSYRGPVQHAMTVDTVEPGHKFSLSFIGPESFIPTIIQFFEREANREYNGLKERTDISVAYGCDSCYEPADVGRTIGWWDIENDWVAFKNTRYSRSWLDGITNP